MSHLAGQEPYPMPPSQGWSLTVKIGVTVIGALGVWQFAIDGLGMGVWERLLRSVWFVVLVAVVWWSDRRMRHRQKVLEQLMREARENPGADQREA